VIIKRITKTPAKPLQGRKRNSFLDYFKQGDLNLHKEGEV
jgi:hypothetical protein